MNDNDPSDNDKKLFRQAMKDVKPLRTKHVKHQPTKKTIPISPQRLITHHSLPAGESPAFTALDIHLSDHYADAVNSESVLVFSRKDLDKQRLKALKTGNIRYQGILDLHGLNADQAREKLASFIPQQMSQGHRCVLIIHGKGSLHGEAPILKNLVNHWLKQIPQILAFHSALPKDGGCGALYVLLKKSRNAA